MIAARAAGGNAGLAPLQGVEQAGLEQALKPAADRSRMHAQRKHCARGSRPRHAVVASAAQQRREKLTVPVLHLPI